MPRINFVFILLVTLIIGSCAPQQETAPRQSQLNPYGSTSSQIFEDTSADIDASQSPATNQANGRVALLLPLTGTQAVLGQNLLNAAQMALFDLNDPSLTLIPIDTKGTINGARAAVSQAAEMNVQLILGPLLSSSVKAAGQSASRYGLNLVSFTTDSAAIGSNVFTLGILPNDQGARLAEYASKNNLKRVVVLSANDQYSRVVLNAFEINAQNLGLTITQKLSMNNTSDINQIAQQLYQNNSTYDAILIPFGNSNVLSLVRQLRERNITPSNTAFLGTGLWDDEVIRKNIMMQGALFVAPPTQMRQGFKNNYQLIYSNQPHRLSSLAYDAMALSSVLLQQSQGRTVSRATILNRNGFAGLDGVFRFQPNGQVERGLAVHRISTSGQTLIADPAPQSFGR